jgi:hypothetical protein
LINLQELDVIKALTDNDTTLITSGIIALAFPDVANRLRIEACLALEVCLSKHSDTKTALPVGELTSCGSTTLLRYKNWFRLDTHRFNPLATAIYYSQLLKNNALLTNSPSPDLLATALITLNFTPACLATFSVPPDSLANLFRIKWQEATHTSPLIFYAQAHLSFSIHNLGVICCNDIPTVLKNWINVPILLGQYKSHWLSPFPDFPTLKPETPPHIVQDLKENFTELHLAQSDNIINTRAAIFSIAKTLGDQNISVTNPIWQNIVKLSPTI